MITTNPQTNKVNASDSTRSAVAPERRVFSLKQVMLLLTVSVVAVVVVFAGVSFHLLQQQLADLRAAESREQLFIAKETIAQRLKFYDDLLTSYARDHQIRDLISFADTAGAVSWSTRVRSALPQAIGAALFSRDGEVLGDPLAQRVGASCVVDLQHRIAGTRLREIPLHQAIPTLAHFDLTAPVQDESGDTLGLVFVSFSTIELKDALNRLAGERGAAALMDRASGKVFITSSNWDALATAALRVIPVDGTNWMLQIRTTAQSLTPALPALGMVIFGGAGLVVTLMLIFNRVLARDYFENVEEIRAVLRRILAGERVDASELAERQSFFPLGHQLSEDLAHLGSRHKDLHVESRTDALTGLANRRLFDDRLDRLLARLLQGGAGFCVVLLDLDDFKRTNDDCGHAAGDLVLRALATALQGVVRTTDLASRWGGDEFAALLVDLPPGEVEGWIDRLRTTFDTAQREMPALPAGARCGVSCGYVCVTGDNAADASTLLDEADRRLYTNKQSRKV